MGHATPPPFLVDGLRQLLSQVGTFPDDSSASHNGSDNLHSDLISVEDDRVQYCHVDVQELCDDASFEAVMCLLLNRQQPDMEELADVSSVLADAASIDQPVVDTIGTVPLQTRPLDLLPLSIALLSCFDPTPADRCLQASQSQFWRVMAQLPVLFHVAFGGRLKDGRIAGVGESESLSYAGRLLQVLRDDDRVPTAAEERAMNAVMICECVTEMRPASLLARFFGSAVNDTVAGLKAASSLYVSQLRNDPFSWTTKKLREFQSPEEAHRWWLSRQPRSMPFGFQDASEDPRTGILRNECRELLGSVPAMVLESCAARLESLQARQEKFPTTDWVAARTLTLLNVPEDRISLAVGIARMVGWAANTIEQHTAKAC